MSTIVDRRYMEFRIVQHHFAIPLLSVKEVISKPELTTVPNMPAHFEGMINLRGQILGVYSAKKKLGVTAKPGEKPAAEKAPGAQGKSLEVVVVLEIDGSKVGVIVDEVVRVLHVEADMLKEVPVKTDDPAMKYVSAIIQVESELIQAIDMAALLDSGGSRAKRAA